MLRVTPLYGSRWDRSGASRSGSCTLVEYADIKILVDVGLRTTNCNTTTANNKTKHKNGEIDGVAAGAAFDKDKDIKDEAEEASVFWETLPTHDCLVITDSTLESMGSLPLYVEGIRRAAYKRRQQRLEEIRKRRRSSLQRRHRKSSFNSSTISHNLSNFIGSKLDEETLLQDDDMDNTTTNNNTNNTLGDSTTMIVPPIFATFPTVKMGQMSLYDYHANICLDGGKPPFSLEEMDRAIAYIRTIKYSQSLSFPMSSLDLEPPPSPFVSRNSSTINNNNNKTKSGDGTLIVRDNTKPRLSVTAHMAGHVVGCAFYKLVRIQDETSVTITHAYHIARELHLDASTLLQYGTGSDVLITKPGGPASFPVINSLYSTSGSLLSSSLRNKINNSSNKYNSKISKPILVSPLISKVRRDITDRILSLLRRDANVLLPVDASGRSLELILLLNLFWSKQNLSSTYNLVWFGSMVHNTLEFGRSQLEWMNSALSSNIFNPSSSSNQGQRRNRFGNDKNNANNTKNSSKNETSIVTDGGHHPYMLRNVQLCTNMAEFDKIISNSNDKPTCVLANGLSLDHGPARDLFLKWSDNDNNGIIFTDSSECLPRRNGSSGSNKPVGAAVASRHGNNRRGSGVLEQKTDGQSVTEGTSTLTTTAAAVATMNVDSGSAINASIIDGTPTTTTIGTNTAIGTVDTTGIGAALAAENEEAAAAEENDVDMAGMALTEEEASKYTAAYQLLKSWSEAKMGNREMDDIVEVDALIPRRAPLIGQDLVGFLEQEEHARIRHEEQEEEKAMLREVELAKGRLRLGNDINDDDGDDANNVPSKGVTSILSAKGGTPSMETGNQISTASGSTGAAAPAASHLPFFRRPKKSRFNQSLFLKFSKPLHLTFELREDAVGVGQRDVTAKFGIGESIENSSNKVLEDDYGIAVIHDQFHDIVSGIDPSKIGQSGRIGDDIARRGLGFSSSVGKGEGNKYNGGSGSLKRRRDSYKNDGTVSNIGGGKDGGIGGNNNGDDDDEHNDDIDNDERGLEAIDLSEGKGIIRGRNGRQPTKVTTVNRRIEVTAEIDYIPFEGRVDSRSARQSVRALQPRQVVVLGGTASAGDDDDNMDAVIEDGKDDSNEEEHEDGPISLVDEVKTLADAAKGFVGGGSNDRKKHKQKQSSVLTPNDGETVELDVGHSAYPARLISTPFRTKEEKELETVRPDAIELPETKIGACTVSLLDFIATGQKVALDGSIVLAPRGKTKKNGAICSAAPSPVHVSDGEVLLTDLRTELIVQHGMKAEYSTHAGYSQLVVNGRIIVKKMTSGGHFGVEGPLCQDFFTVRAVVCSQYVTLYETG